MVSIKFGSTTSAFQRYSSRFEFKSVCSQEDQIQTYEDHRKRIAAVNPFLVQPSEHEWKMDLLLNDDKQARENDETSFVTVNPFDTPDAEELAHSRGSPAQISDNMCYGLFVDLKTRQTKTVQYIPLIIHDQTFQANCGPHYCQAPSLLDEDTSDVDSSSSQTSYSTFSEIDCATEHVPQIRKRGLLLELTMIQYNAPESFITGVIYCDGPDTMSKSTHSDLDWEEEQDKYFQVNSEPELDDDSQLHKWSPNHLGKRFPVSDRIINTEYDLWLSLRSGHFDDFISRLV